MKAAWIAACCLLLSGAVQGGTRDPSTSDQKHLDYGAKFSCVARFTSVKAGKTQMASCVLVSPNHAITAAHAVSGCEPGEIILDNGDRHGITEMSVHPGYDEDTLGTTDVAVVRTSREFHLNFYPQIYARRDEIGQVVSICGYGITGTFHTGAVLSDGKKRAGSNTVEGEIKDMLTCAVGGKRRTSLEFMVAPGDSGGGMFIGNEVCGINSLVLSPPGRVPLGQYGDESGHTRLSNPEIREWILEKISQ